MEFPTNEFFIGEITASSTQDRSMTGGKPDIKKINRLLLTMPGMPGVTGEPWNRFGETDP